MRFVIAIPCYNEEQNIGALLETLDEGWEAHCRPEKILVFSSACRDRTEKIVTRFARDSRIPVALKTETERRGKCYAVNRLMEMAGNIDVIVMISGDVLAAPAAITIMVQRFADRRIGVVGGRPVPVPGRGGMLERTVRTMWHVHHQMVLLEPKTTEVTAFRPLGFQLDEASLVDEAEIEYHLTRAGMKIAYCPAAIIRNTLPGTFRDHIRQRTRVTLGHLVLAAKRKHWVGSLKTGVRLQALKNYLAAGNPDPVALFCMLTVESIVWIFARYAFWVRKPETRGVWQRIDSAKVSLPRTSRQDAPKDQQSV